MKNIYSFFILFSLSFYSFAQLDRSKLPEPGSIPKINIDKAESFTLKNGLKVFVVEDHKLPQVSFNMIVDRKPLLEGNKAGYASLAGSLMKMGTNKRSKDKIDEEIDYIGATFSIRSTGFYASGLKKNIDGLLDIVSDVLLNPTFPEEELEKLKKKEISNLRSSEDEPNAISNRVQGAVFFGLQHPYGEIMNKETVANITRKDCEKYYKTWYRPNISYLVIVGDVTLNKAKNITKRYFGKWKKANVPNQVFESVTRPEKPTVVFVDRNDAVQSVIKVGYPIKFVPGNDDAIPAKVMNYILGGGASSRLFMNLREDKAYTYGAYSSLKSDEFMGRFNASASVRNAVTNNSISEIMHEINKISSEKVPQKELDRSISYLTGSFARSLEDKETIGNFALNIERYGLQTDYYQNYLKTLSAVNTVDIKKMADKYLKPDNCYIIVVGNKAEVTLDEFGPIKYYDKWGSKVE